jgi:hypothetical protein
MPQDLMHWTKLKEFLANGIEYLEGLQKESESLTRSGQINGYKVALEEMERIEKQWL